MVTVQEQYEVYPYPERNPQDEKTRLITGSPSHPLEIDHFLFGGTRDWSRPLRALVAGGGTGDGLIQLAQVLTSAGRPYDITYLDLSAASRRIAEERARVRGLEGITFVTGSLLDAPDYGPFDYIDCCGVLHHLPEPKDGFAALRRALADGGGLGCMVYATYGRSGVYPLQEAFGSLLDGLPPKARIDKAKALVAALPAGHPFAANTNLGDHRQSDAGFYDLLLHSQDRSYDVAALAQTLKATDWQLLSFAMPALYDLSRLTDVPDGMDRITQMGLAEKLRGTIKTHVAYAVPAGDTRAMAQGGKSTLVPHLRGVQAGPLAKAVAAGRSLPVNFGEGSATLVLPKSMARVIAAIDGRRCVGDLRQISGLDPIRFGADWGRMERDLVDWGLLLYSNLKA